MKKSSRYIIEAIIISTILISTFIFLYSKNKVEFHTINSGDSITIDNYTFEFTLKTERVWGAGYGDLRVLFEFAIHVDLIEDNQTNFELESFMVMQGDEYWNKGTVLVRNREYYEYYHFTIGRVDGPLWECRSELTVIADISSDLDLRTILHVEEESTVNCWG